MKHYLFASLTIVALFVLAWADAPAWLNLGIAGLLLTPLVFHVDDLKRQIEVLEWAEEGSNELFNDLDAAIEKRDEEIRHLQSSDLQLELKANKEEVKRLVESVQDLYSLRLEHKLALETIKDLKKQITHMHQLLNAQIMPK